MADLFDADDAATPLLPEERAGLKMPWIAFRHELNAAEQENIALGVGWAERTRQNMFSDRFARELHRRMFGHVWDWAGRYRATERNIGVPPWRIPQDTAQALQDAAFWVEARSYPPDELAIRLHHQLVLIHPFPNGNGRWSRLMADLAVSRLGGERFTWGGQNIARAGEIRRQYVEALRQADRHEIGALLAFARSD